MFFSFALLLFFLSLSPTSFLSFPSTQQQQQRPTTPIPLAARTDLVVEPGRGAQHPGRRDQRGAKHERSQRRPPRRAREERRGSRRRRRREARAEPVGHGARRDEMTSGRLRAREREQTKEKARGVLARRRQMRFEKKKRMCVREEELSLVVFFSFFLFSIFFFIYIFTKLFTTTKATPRGHRPARRGPPKGRRARLPRG